MIYRIKKEVFLKDVDFYLKELKKVDFYKKFLNLLIERLDENDLDDISKSIYFTPDVIIYRGLVNITKETKEFEELNYIFDCDVDSKQGFIDLMYQQRILHFSGKLPLCNQIVDVLENGDIINSKKEKLGDVVNGIPIEKLEYKNLMSLKGKYFTDLNPLYDFSKIGNDIPNCIDIEEYNKKTELLNKVSKEVKEVNQEQLIYLCELMTNVENNQNLFNKIFEQLVNTKEVDK